jgi:ferredoxin-NADP reductase/fatty acid desaturase
MQKVTKNYTALWQGSIPNIAWGTLALLLMIVCGYILVVSSTLAGLISYPFASIICTYLCFASFTIQHDAGHGNIFKMGSALKPLENAIGWVASIPLLVSPYRLFKTIHDRHHAFTNDPERDPDHFSFGTKWYQILLNTYYMPLKYLIMALTTLRHIKIFRDTYISSALYLLLVLGSLAVLAFHGYTSEVFTFALIPTVITTFLLVIFFDYVPHHPHKSQGRYHNTRIYPSKILNILLLGQNYHLIHHMYPRLPWYTYQTVFYKILPDLEAHGAPIEYMTSDRSPSFMKSANAHNLQNGGRSVNMLLKVVDIEALTEDSVAVSFALPVAENLIFRAGQYITISKWLAGEQHTRCYSLCSSPHNTLLKIAVRGTYNGLVSTYINNDLQVGNELIIQGPFGDFVYPPITPRNIQALVLIAGGSGITPMLSILLSSLQQNDDMPIHLVYAARSADNIMFFDVIETLRCANPERLTVAYVVKDLVSHKLATVGRLNSALLEALLPMLGENADKTQSHATEFYVCGPEGLKNEALNALTANSIANERVHIEQFIPTITHPQGALHKIGITLKDGHKHVLNVASNQTVLEVAKANGVMLPHACGSGTCGTCKFKIDSGQTSDISDTIPGITADEQTAGFTLACQCKPQSDLALSGM